MIFDLFVLPFTVGLLFLFSLVIYKFTVWLKKLPAGEKSKFRKGFFSKRIFNAIAEVFMESLLHRKIFRVNPLLGFMHMSLAFGWFLLIVVGNIETRIHSGRELNGPFYPIFFKFFEHNREAVPFNNFFVFVMDFLLLFVLIGVALAFSKRLYSGLFGMKSTTRLKTGDKFALYSLWFIFPLRFLAESFSAAIHHTGGFFTGTAGEFFNSFLPVSDLKYIAWWAYSFALGLFFVSLPFSRYMHIPTEVLLIFLRNFGIKNKGISSGMTAIEVYSCPRCGICIDKCQLNTSIGNRKIQPAYFLREVRYHMVNEKSATDCLLCGRCEEYCPVGISLNNIRIAKRTELFINHNDSFNYLSLNGTEKAEVIYFAGCMTHLTPSIKLSMKKILTKAGINFWFMDEDGSVCCGRPLMMSGNMNAAFKLIENNKYRILHSGANILVTSCPICLKIFKDEYKLGINVMHHSEYILQLILSKKLNISKSDLSIAYHDPCELGRGGGIYEEPRELISMTAKLLSGKYEKNNSLCCGGSLGNTVLNHQDRMKIAANVVKHLTEQNPDILITACPLCKKTFASLSQVEVMDIAEWIVHSIFPLEKSLKNNKQSENKKIQLV